MKFVNKESVFFTLNPVGAKMRGIVNLDKEQTINYGVD